MGKVYQCGKCMNWYAAIPVGPDEFCVSCDRGLHIAHPKTGIIDCHFGEQSAHPSEIGMATLVQTLENIRLKVESAKASIERATTVETVKKLLSTAESTAMEAEREERKVAELMRWSGVFEMPGMAGSDPTARFKSTEALENLVARNRRPSSDLDYVRRSARNCVEMEERIPGLVGEIRASLFDVRKTADGWTAPAKMTYPEPNTTKRAYRKREKVLA